MFKTEPLKTIKDDNPTRHLLSSELKCRVRLKNKYVTHRISCCPQQQVFCELGKQAKENVEKIKAVIKN